MMRHDALVGGIYMCSNVDNSTAVWNQYINDRNGRNHRATWRSGACKTFTWATIETVEKRRTSMDDR